MSYDKPLITTANYAGGIPYRSENMAAWDAAREAANSTAVDIVLVTDSIGEVGVDVATDRPWGWLLSDLLNRYIQSDPPVGYVPINAGTSPVGPHFSATTSTYSGSGFGGHSGSHASGDTSEHTATCDRISVIYRQSSGGGTITIKDGGSGGTTIGTINASGTDTWSVKWDSAALSAGSHDIYISVSGGSGTFIEGVYFYYNNYSTGFRVWPANKSGQTSAGALDGTRHAYFQTLTTTLNPALVVLCTGVNDTLISDYDNGMRNLVAASIAAAPNASQCLWIPYILPSSARFTKTDVEVGRAIARDYNMGVIDNSIGLPDMSVSGAGLKYDSTHPNRKGRIHLALHAASVLTGDPIGTALYAGSFAVKGPSSSTDLAIPRFKYDSGQELEDTQWTIADNGAMFSDMGTDGSIGYGPVFGKPFLFLYDDSADTQPSTQLGGAALNFGAGGTTAVDVTISRTAADTLSMASGDKIQQSQAPSTANDLVNKTYADTPFDVMPTNAVAQSLPRWIGVGNLSSLTSGTLVMQAIMLRAGQVITTITYSCRTTALSGGNNQWFGLFDANRVCLAVTNDDTSTAWSSGALKSLNLTSPYTITTTGQYYVGIMVKATTVPTLAGIANAATPLVTLAPKLMGSANTGLTTPFTVGNTAAALTTIGTGFPYFYLS